MSVGCSDGGVKLLKIGENFEYKEEYVYVNAESNECCLIHDSTSDLIASGHT